MTESEGGSLERGLDGAMEGYLRSNLNASLEKLRTANPELLSSLAREIMRMGAYDRVEHINAIADSIVDRVGKESDDRATLAHRWAEVIVGTIEEYVAEHVGQVEHLEYAAAESNRPPVQEVVDEFIDSLGPTWSDPPPES